MALVAENCEPQIQSMVGKWEARLEVGDEIVEAAEAQIRAAMVYASRDRTRSHRRRDREMK